MKKKKLSDEDEERLLIEFGFKKIEVSAEEREKFRQDLASVFSTKQEVIFSGDTSCGIRLDILNIIEEIIKKHVPIVSNLGSTLTTKKIIDIDYIRRVGGPSSMLALIKVSFSGLMCEECWKLEGFYILRLDPAKNGYAVKVEKFDRKEKIYEGVFKNEITLGPPNDDVDIISEAG